MRQQVKGLKFQTETLPIRTSKCVKCAGKVKSDGEAFDLDKDDDQLRALAASGENSAADRCVTKSHSSWCSQTGDGLGRQVGRFEERGGTEGEGKATALARTFWTPEEDNRLRMLLGAGRPIEIVATELKRSAKAVKGRAYMRY